MLVLSSWRVFRVLVGKCGSWLWLLMQIEEWVKWLLVVIYVRDLKLFTRLQILFQLHTDLILYRDLARYCFDKEYKEHRKAVSSHLWVEDNAFVPCPYWFLKERVNLYYTCWKGKAHPNHGKVDEIVEKMNIRFVIFENSVFRSLIQKR